MLAGFNAKTAVVAGLAAGLIFLMVEMILVPVTGGAPFGPPRMMAAIVMGQSVLPPPATFDAAIFAVAMIVHFVLSIVLGLIWGLIGGRFSGATALAAGGAFGLIIYLVNFYGMTAVFPWFAMARNWVTILAHIIFGLSLAGVYLKLAKPSPQMSASA
jgi:uncharacterized membrane protein YagU involved in acid resistance